MTNMYIKKALLLLLLFYCSIATAQYSNADTIHWKPNYELTWGDFQGVPTDSINAAVTIAGFTTKSRYVTDSTISVMVSAVFYKKMSWVKKAYETEYNLNHEQRHFDIAEIYARKANVAFKKYKFNSATVADDINRLFNYYDKQCNKMQEKYDNETTYPNINKRRQKEWDDKIDKLLKST